MLLLSSDTPVRCQVCHLIVVTFFASKLWKFNSCFVGVGGSFVLVGWFLKIFKFFSDTLRYNQNFVMEYFYNKLVHIILCVVR